MQLEFARRGGSLRFAPPPLKTLVLGLLVVCCGLGIVAAGSFVRQFVMLVGGSADASLGWIGWGIAAVGCLPLVMAVIWFLMRRDHKRIEDIARKVLCTYKYGNPLGLADLQALPKIRCTVFDRALPSYRLRVVGYASTVEQLEDARSALSSALRGRFEPFAVVRVDVGAASQYVDFYLEDVMKDRQIKVSSLGDLRSGDVTKLRVQDGLDIDLTSSGSIVCAGKTRSGKTSGVLALLLGVASYGADNFGSQVVIVDPKRAELSRLPGVLIPDENGEARAILDALQAFEETIKRRQQVLNDESERLGDAVKWWDVGMHPSFIFIDEFVALKSLYPTSTAKDFEGYRLKDFEAVLRRIVTMGASAGCFVIISIAQANAEQLPTMLRDAFSTRVLFRPTADEGRLLWDSEQVAGLPPKIYSPGDAWFTSTDGVNDAVRAVKFPWWTKEFKPYAELARLLVKYQANDRGHCDVL